MRHNHHLNQKRPRKKQLIGGLDNVIEALKKGVAVDKIFVLKNTEDAILKALAAEHNIPVSAVPEGKLRSFNLGDNDGVIALKSRITYYDLQNIISMVVESGDIPLFLLLDGITDIRNIGGIARTAWCCGVNAIVLPQKGVGSLNDDAITTSAGALEKIPVCRAKTLEEATETLRLNGITIMASEMTAETSIFDTDLTCPVAIIMGREDKGVHSSLYKRSDIIFKIPMKNDFESLNVSAATAMILYETMKQRMSNTRL